ncbi:hypothetical protein [Urbanus proteus nucleopolyhedrovirus]|uniref:Uncharacterized protein n=1 Tax=Urbanus proteus nucleopolyhedrovirus TaxID=1675866 RepID=A0A161C6Z4_9ABAC|nr:hypothetical protein [Urbanus proteus nucleopolyhedrovirus]AKR17385.1 hypothetical protein [Urbanus proteus nucleopolyhedrovirus]
MKKQHTSVCSKRYSFYNVCSLILQNKFINQTNSTLHNLIALFDYLICTEKALFNKSYVLQFLINFLSINSETTNSSTLKNTLYVQLLYYLLTKYT